MEKIVEFFNNITNDNQDHIRLVEHLSKIKNSDKTVHIISGNGNNGKSTIVTLISKILHDEVMHLPSNIFQASDNFGSTYSYPGLTDIDGKKYIIFSEISANNDVWNSSILKELSGNDVIMTRELYGSAKKIQPPTNGRRLIFVTNEEIDIDSLPASAKDKINLIELKKYINNPDPDLVEEISEAYLENLDSYIFGRNFFDSESDFEDDSEDDSEEDFEEQIASGLLRPHINI